MRQKILASRHARRLIEDTKVRFFLVGILNTSVDFGVYNALLFVSVSPSVASIFSTSAAMCVSYVLNKTVVFKAGDSSVSKEAIQFFVVTIFGQWVVQSVIIFAITQWLRGGFPEWLLDNSAKVVAVGASTVWNYLWYSRVVFAKKGSKK